MVKQIKSLKTDLADNKSAPSMALSDTEGSATDEKSSSTELNLTNHFLIAMPSMQDPVFGGSVVFICEHSPRGAMGMLINRPTDMNVAGLFDRIDLKLENIPDSHPMGKDPVMFGGPVQDDRGFVLHAPVGKYTSSLQVTDDIAFTTSRDVLEAMIMAHEIQGVIALENSFNRVGLDHVILVKVASTAVVAKLMGANREQLLSALSHAFADGQALRTYRHAPNAGSRKSWAAGDASSRGVRLADIAMRGEMGIPGVLTAKQWGFYDVLFSHTNSDLALKPDDKRAFSFSRSFGSYVMENVLFKISFPAEFHAQTACEAAVTLHPQVRNRLHEIDRIVITTHESAIRIISKVGPLANAADRDHCIQYMTAVPLAFGNLVAEQYEDDFHAAHPIIDVLREKMVIVEDPRFTREYLEADKRSIANAVQVFFKDGSSTEQVAVEYPIGHRRRRAEGIPLLEDKFKANLATRFTTQRATQIFQLCKDPARLEATPVHRFVDLLVI